MRIKILPIIQGSKVSSWTPKTHFSGTDILKYMIMWVGGRKKYQNITYMGSNPVQAWIFFRLSFRNCLSCVVTAKIFLLFDLSSAVQIYVSYIYIHLFILHGYITNSQYDQLPVGLIAQLVEHCTGIAEVMGSNPVQAWIFFQAFFSQLLKLRSNCEDLSSIWLRTL